jgi:peptide-methionine (S)-S-oxide reductase
MTASIERAILAGGCFWPGKVVTEVTPAGAFWEAEPEHRDYLERYPNGYTCHFIRPDWTFLSRSGARRAS